MGPPECILQSKRHDLIVRWVYPFHEGKGTKRAWPSHWLHKHILPKDYCLSSGSDHMKCKNPGECLQPASALSFAQTKGLWRTMRAFRIVVGIKATTAQLVDLYVNACLRWWLFIIVNAFGLKDVGFIRLLKPISVLVVNNRVPAPFSKMYTNSLRNLSKFSNTLVVFIHLI